MNIVKKGVVYYQKENGTLYCGPLDQSYKVGGTGEEARNSIHNPTRLQRILEINPQARVLDFGCGNGLLVNFLREKGVWVEGYDKFASLYAGPLPDNSYDIITAIEVFEHLSEPYIEVDEIFNALKDGGTIMIETSFSDWLTEKDSYIDPDIGHSTIFSHRGLDELMVLKGFKIGNHINRNVRLYKKPSATK